MKQKTCAVVNLDDVEREARKSLQKPALDYYQSGATGEVTLRRNCSQFERIQIRPRMLRTDVSRRCLATSILGIPIQFPVCVSPTAMQRMATPMGEVDNAKACAAEGVIMTLSTISTSSLEEVAQATPNSAKFFQLYIYKNRALTEKLISRAEKSGFKALMLTVDTPFMGQRYADERNEFCLPSHLRMANFDDGCAESNQINQVKSKDKPSSGLTEYTQELFDQSLTWADVDWLRSRTKLPIIVKGILTKEDALIALEHKVDAIMVSNHGGRQLDTVPSTIEALIEVVDSVQGQCEVYLDGGIRRGTDVFKALAIGAKAVFIGRPMVYGLAYDGVNGARRVLQILRKEFDFTMGLAGCAKISDIKRSMVIPAGTLLAKL